MVCKNSPLFRKSGGEKKKKRGNYFSSKRNKSKGYKRLLFVE